MNARDMYPQPQLMLSFYDQTSHEIWASVVFGSHFTDVSGDGREIAVHAALDARDGAKAR